MFEPLDRLVFGVVVLLLRCQTNKAWTYRNTSSWGDQCQADQQSPVNIETSVTEISDSLTKIQRIQVATCPMGWFLTNEHTWEVQFRDKDTCAYQVSIKWENSFYYLKSFHFHSPSEHTVNGKNYDMELQMVHENAMGVPLAVAVLIKVGQKSDFFAHILRSFPNVPGEIVAKVPSPLDPYKAFFPQEKGYFTYEGSLTTPPCTTGVRWVVHSTPVTVSAAQLHAFRASISSIPDNRLKVSRSVPDGVVIPWNTGHGVNNRPVQNLKDQKILEYVDGESMITELEGTESKAMVTPLGHRSTRPEQLVALSCGLASAGLVLFFAVWKMNWSRHSLPDTMSIMTPRRNQLFRELQIVESDEVNPA